MMKVMKAAELLIEKIKKDYKDDIAVVVVMGSHLYNQTHAKSDLDMYFIPKTDRGFQLGTVFIIDGIGYDFWPISWDRIARIASHDERIGAIITEGKVIYYGTEDDLNKFNSYKEKALDVQNQGHFIWKAHEKIKSSYMDYVELNRSLTLSDVRFNGIKLIYSVTEAISLLNRITIKRGRGKLLSEILAMPLVPQDFKANYLTLFESHDMDSIKSALLKMFEDTRHLIESTQANHQKGSFKDEAHGFYEELINHYNKIERAYEIHDFQTALFAACEINIELHGILGNRGVDLSCLPDLMQAYDQDNLKPLLDASKKHQEELVALLISHGVSIRIIKDENALKAYLDTL
jgi:hypothetical protein